MPRDKTRGNGDIWNVKCSVNTGKHFCAVRVAELWQDCPQRLWSLFLGKFQKLSGCRPGHPVLGGFAGTGLGQGGPSNHSVTVSMCPPVAWCPGKPPHQLQRDRAGVGAAPPGHFLQAGLSLGFTVSTTTGNGELCPRADRGAAAPCALPEPAGSHPVPCCTAAPRYA